MNKFYIQSGTMPCDIGTTEERQESSRWGYEELIKLIPIQDEWLEYYKRELELDRCSYVFKCEKHGDFLTISIVRNISENAGQYGGQYVKTKFSTSINMSKVSYINFELGDDPRLGNVHYYAVKGQDIFYASNYYSESGNWWEWSYNTPRPRCQRVYITKTPEKLRRGMYYQGEGELSMANFACPDTDDQIRFEGAGTLFVPHGLGESVHARILKELETP